MRAALCALAAGALAVAAAAAQEPVTAAAVEGWADDLFAEALAGRRLSGAVVTVVSGGEIIFEKGYGYADWRAQTAIDPARTMFRIGSATKTFTAVAIEQLIESGAIASLDDPANLYLKRIQLPAAEGREITLRDLATHRAGYADRTFGIASNDPYEPPLSASAIGAHLPSLVRAPGERVVYSNFGSAMLGVVVEDVTGEPIDRYFKDRIFQPLGMETASLLYGGAPPDALAVPYAFLPSGEAQPVMYRGIDPFFAPAGAIAATSRDMARYMIAQLDGARGAPTPLGLAPARFTELQTRAAGNHPSVLGIGSIFMTLDWARERTFGHGGDWPGFHSIVWMAPERDVGVFVSLMAEWPDVSPFDAIGGSAALKPDPSGPPLTPISNIGVLTAFLERFLGPDAPAAAPVPAIPVEELAGSYRHEYRAYGTIAELLDVLNPGAVVRVTAGEGGLTVNGRGPYVHVGGNVYWNEDFETPLDGQFGDTPVWAFSRSDSDGAISVSPRLAIDPFLKVGAMGDPAAYASLSPFGMLVLLTGILAVFWRTKQFAFGHAARVAAIGAGLMILASPIILLARFSGETILGDFLMGERGRFMMLAAAATWLAISAAVLVVSAAVAAFSPREKRPPVIVTAHLVLLAVAGAGALMFLARFHLIGWQAP